MKLSIVIPVYNVEKYIEKCLLSCLNQNLSTDEYEIIVVNDGTQDNSLDIIERIASGCSNISIIYQENGGLSAARNTGLSSAKGEYVWFIDSDDSIDGNCLRSLMSAASGQDVLCIGYIKEFEDGRDSYTQIPPTPTMPTGSSLFCTRRFCVPAQFYIYKRSFLIEKNLSFYNGIYHEDLEFTPRMLCLAQSIAIYPTPIYHYLIRASSITTSVKSKRSFDLIKVAASLDTFYKDILDREVCRTLSYYISMDINNAINWSRNYSIEDKRKLTETLYSNRYLFRHLIDSPMIKNKIEGVLFKLMPNRCLGIYNILINFKK